MTFPDKKFADARSYADAYFAQMNTAASSVDRGKIERAAHVLAKTYSSDGTVYACGNGGSAAISNHLVCDHCKLVQTDTNLTPRIVSLSTTVEMITAIANDISYDEVFVYQLRSMAKPGDALITISSSGELREHCSRRLLGQDKQDSSDINDRVLRRQISGNCGCESARQGRQLRRHRGHPPVTHAHSCPIYPPGAYG